MKCWTRYVLPWVIATCMFLGSSLCSLAANTTDTAQGTGPEGLGYEACFLACRDEVQAVLDGRDYHFDDFYYYGYYDENLDQIKVYLTQIKLVCASYSDTHFVAQVKYLVMYTAVVTRDSKLLNCSYNYYTMNTNLSFPLNSTSFSSYDIYDASGTLFFRGPSPFQRAVRGQDWTTVMTEIVMILPLLIVFLTFLIGLRKGLRLISSLLHRA